MIIVNINTVGRDTRNANEKKGIRRKDVLTGETAVAVLLRLLRVVTPSQVGESFK